MESDSELRILAERLLTAKADEAEARDRRIVVEAQVASLIPTDGAESKTVTLSNGFKIVVKRPISYKADIPGILNCMEGTEYPSPIESKTTHSLDVKGYEWYRDQKPEMFAKLAKFVTVKSLKTSVGLTPPIIR